MLALLVSSALACGGLFCSAPALPVNQSGERIVFALDAPAGEIEMHTKITYEGPAETFAWLVPLPAVPELFVSTDELFTFLDDQTAPIFSLRSSCPCCVDTTDVFDTVAFDTGAPGAAPVVVVATGLVGPYSSAVLQASDAGTLIRWLNDNDYFVPPNVGPFLAPYVANGSYVVALKLQKDRDVGDLVPLGLRFPADSATIPLIMTAVAAASDMPVIPWVLGAGRAVPTNYLHVEINELAIDWWNGGSNYNALVSQAADEAGGQAFATDFASPTTALRDRLVWPGRYNEAALRRETTLRGLWGAVLSQGFVVNDDLTGILSQFFPDSDAVLADVGQGGLPTRDTVCDEPAEIGCDAINPTDVVDQLVAAIITPNLRANALFTDLPYITRLTSSVSPAEMTVDPMFAINPALPDVSRFHTATYESGGCDDGLNRLVLSDGTEVFIPNDQLPMNYLRDLVNLPARTIEQTRASGASTVMVDHSTEIDTLLAGLNAMARFGDELDTPSTDTVGDTVVDDTPTGDTPDETDASDDSDTGAPTVDEKGCGCDAPSAHPAWALALLAAAARRRRRA